MYSFAQRLMIRASLLGGILLLAGTATAGEMIYACAHKNSGDLRVVSAPGQCLKSEYEVSWEDGLELGQQVNELLGRVAAIEAALGVLNEAPSVAAGDDQTILLSMVANFSGYALDDGLLEPLSFLWEKVAGPGTVSFTNPDSLLTNVTFSNIGDYTFRLSVFDGAITVSDEMLVIVYPDNDPPVIVKDYDPLVVPARRWRQSGYWTLSCSEVDLGVTVTDDDLPQPLSVSWTIDNRSMYGGVPSYNDLTANFTTSPSGSAQWPLSISSRLLSTSYPPSYVPQYLVANLSLATSDGYHAVNETLQVKCDVAASSAPVVEAGGPIVMTGTTYNNGYRCLVPLAGTVEDDGLPEVRSPYWSAYSSSPQPDSNWALSANASPQYGAETTLYLQVLPRHFGSPIPNYVTVYMRLNGSDGYHTVTDVTSVQCIKP